MIEHDESTEPTPDETNGVEDFDAFWQTVDRRVKRTRIMGELTELPPALPLQFELEARRLQRSKRPEDIRKLVACLFGPDALATWTAKGMDTEQFSVLLAWAPQVIAGKDVTLADVAAELRKREAQAEAQGGEGADPT